MRGRCLTFRGTCRILRRCAPMAGVAQEVRSVPLTVGRSHHRTSDGRAENTCPLHDYLKLNSFEFQLQTRLIFGSGAISRLGELARELGFRRTLLVADQGL